MIPSDACIVVHLKLYFVNSVENFSYLFFKNKTELVYTIFTIYFVFVYRFLATGDSYQTIAFSYRLGHSTVHAIVQEVCYAIINKLLRVYIPTPQKNDWEHISQRFWTAWNFPNCLGALDGKHIEIVAPDNSGSNYFNYKKTFSVVLLALVDANYKLIAVDIGSYGKNSDGGIFANSRLGKQLENGTLQVPPNKNLPETDIVAPYIILGDSAFPLKTYLLRPFSQVQTLNDVEKSVFNYRHCRARRVVENAFGILAQRFRIYFRKINSKPGYIEKIILTTCILHNYLRSNNVNIQEEGRSVDNNECILRNLPGQGGNAQQEAFNTREIFTRFFNSEAGSVPWQYEKI